MRMEANRYGETASLAESPILRIDHGHSREYGAYAELIGVHSHPEPKLLWSSTATVTVATESRDWLVPPGYGLWIPGGAPHGGGVLHAGEGSAMTFDPAQCPISWTEVTGIQVSPLLRELITHLDRIEPADPSRPAAEALLFGLLAPLPAHDIQITMPTDPRVRVIAERLIAAPADQRDLAAWADLTHAGVRTLSRLFVAETGLSFAEWRTQVRIRAAIQRLSAGASVSTTARAVGYGRPSSFIDAFRRVTGQTPGTYLRDS